ncbi:MAG: hypothetical protein C7B43_09030 [Sulfobacillus benefaciens]|uniref:Uncharacterized protein n=1 Tax=Sulfobacillus benefaciens TaxID=453960 RepID=A0A2T2X3R8_9FIRM|nr:MAG: hypothetical protein C7B43_09030 [Sulfobacillus benefaciens]HBQ94489.1 hypothetical protein [Sulfobacillus sp.]
MRAKTGKRTGGSRRDLVKRPGDAGSPSFLCQLEGGESQYRMMQEAQANRADVFLYALYVTDTINVIHKVSRNEP